jgi:hypothetical protein
MFTHIFGEYRMKSILVNTVLCFTLALSLNSCSCQGQPRTVLGGPSDTTVVPPPPAEILRNLILGDSIPVISLTAIQQEALVLRYRNNPAISGYTVIENPFPRADSLGAFRKLRCNMSARRVFTAELTDLRIDYTLSRPDLVWEGKLVGTGETIIRPDWNWIKITTRRDEYVTGGYRFTGAALRVNSSEAYLIEDLPPSYFVVVRYAPERIGIMQDRVIPDLATR